MLLYRASNSQKIFTEAEFLAVVNRFHPLAKKANLDVNIAEANVVSSKSGFDPVYTNDNSRKELEGVFYYQHRVNEVKIPTWYGADVVIGKENISGLRLNPRETEGAVSYVGISIPVLRNLVMDKRRAAIQQAKQYLSQTQWQRLQTTNELKRNALIAYWNWWEYHQQYLVIEAAKISSEKRHAMVRSFYLNGERPAIDTIEALTLVQYFNQRLSEANMLLQKSRIELSGYLWKDDERPYELPDDVYPQPSPVQQQLNLKYNQLGKQKDFIKTLNGAWFENNFQFGLSLSMPLRLSEGRGEYRKAKFYIEQMKLEQANKTVEIKNKVKQHFTEWEILTSQIFMQEQYVSNIQKLQTGEESRFMNGESSLFIINSREMKTLESKEKLLELKAKNIRSYINVKWATGIIE
jgi:outer membrane protein TolC